MATTPDKVQEFKQSIQLAVSPKLAHEFSALAQGSAFNEHDFERIILNAPGEAARAQENEILASNGSIESQIARSGQFSDHQRRLLEERRTGKSANGMDVAFLQLLSDIEAMDRRLAELRGEIDQYEAKFEAQYGPEWRETFAEAYLSDEEMAAFEGLTGKERDQAIIEALKAKMLDENGDIKPEYAGLEVAEYLQTLDEEKVLSAERTNADDLLLEFESGEISKTPQADGMMDATTSKLGAQFNSNASVSISADEKSKLQEVREAQDAELVPEGQSSIDTIMDFGKI